MSEQQNSPANTVTVVTNRIPVAEGFEAEFEERFRNRAHLVDQSPGFIRNEVHRPRPVRFDHEKGWVDDPDAEAYYEVKTWWRSFDDFVAWTRSESFAEAHSNRPPKEMFAGPSKIMVHEVFLSTTGAEAAAQEALECPKCTGEMMRPETTRGASYLRCPGCKGMYFERKVLDQLLTDAKADVDTLKFSAASEAMDGIQGTCHRCAVPMGLHKGNINVDHCPSCGSIFLDEGEFATLQLHRVS